MISPIPLLGPEASNRMSFAILFNETAICFKAPWVSTIASCAAIDSNLFFALIKGKDVNFAICFATILSYPIGVLMPVPTAVAPSAISDK